MSIRQHERRAPTVAVAAVIVIIAAVFRVVGFDWDRRRLLHPDERFLVMTTAAMPLPASIAAYLDGARSPLNPRRPGRSFAYGTLPLTLARVAMPGTVQPTHAQTVRSGRALSVACDLGTLLVLGWLARRLFGSRTALLAMAFYACAVLPIQHSHFFVVDPMLVLWSTVAVAALTAWHQRPGVGWAAAAGAATALAIACKATGSALIVPAAIAWATRVVTRRGVTTSWRAWRRATAHAGAYALAGLVALRLAAPDMFAPGLVPWPSPLWIDDLRQIARLADGLDDWPPSFQWAGRAIVWFPLWNLVRFGLGIPLGVTALAGVLAATWIALGRWRSRLVVPATWTVVLTVIVCAQLTASMRYLLPVYPMLCLLAAWGLVVMIGRAWASPRRWARPVAIGLAAVVVLATAAWAVAFTSIYRQLHPRLVASRWIFDTIPAGTVLTAEAWDDALPISASQRTHASRYTILTLPVTDPDRPEKVDTLVTSLDRAEYVIVSSGRNAETLVRLPWRFPMMVRYYAALADGRLGFDPVAEFRAVPRLGPISWPDAHAEEAFTVYDHPAVRIYRKSPRWSADAARTLLRDVDWDGVVHVTARSASRAPGLLELTRARREFLLHEGSWRSGAGERGRFPARRVSEVSAVLRWAAALAVLAAFAWPACAVLLPNAWGRGVLVAPALGLLWVSVLAWFWGTLAPVPLSLPIIVASVASLGLVSAVLAWPQRVALHAWVRSNRRLLLAQAAWVAAAAVAGTAIRAANPDLWHPYLGGEKPMDIALLSALVRADRFPAFDPWFAGGVLNYYYLGFLPVALLCRLTGVEPALGYTLAVGTWWAMTGSGIAFVAGTLAHRLGLTVRAGRAALAAAAIGVVCGNLRQLELLWQSWAGPVVPWAWYWHASRAIPAPAGEAAPITEFPFFTFLFADLHAHLLAMPWLLATVALSIEIASRPRVTTRSLLTGVLVGGTLVGVLAATNAWDAPTAFVLIAGAIATAAFTGVPASAWPGVLRRTVLAAAGVALVAAIVSWPFWSHYAAPVGGVSPWRGARSPLIAWLAVHGPFLLVLVPALARLTWASEPSARSALHRWFALLILLGLCLVAVVEVLVVRGDVGRMNTVFKIYLQAWLVWSCCVPAGWLLVRQWLRAHPRGRGADRAFIVATTVVGMAMLAYPATATWPRLHDRMAPGAPRGLDGSAFMTHAQWTTAAGSIPLAEDREVVRWLLDHVKGTPTIIEAQTDQYQWGGRISAHTGLPTVLGWTWHARQQRLAVPARVVGRRYRDVRTFFETSSPDDAWQIARRYDVRYVVVGRLERQLYAGAGLDKFDTDPRWQRVVAVGATRVYARAE